MLSRNKREGKYAGRVRGNHFRTKYPFVYLPRSYVAISIYYLM